ncbi:hypothetical protein WR25_11058 [Diploscapter pachys]|uniref:Uncharacterized protein n=1 Tax=Diploscapter pachys TaxID=2018661 RepID=A0A2A2K3E4_9BILA|nr:hypothetical protein WR25_11058 [Diploscapter pachys]
MRAASASLIACGLPMLPRKPVTLGVFLTRKNSARMVVMMTTMTPVMIVSRRVGQTTFLVSAWTWRMNSMGVVFATVFLRNPLESRKSVPPGHEPSAAFP